MKHWRAWASPRTFESVLHCTLRSDNHVCFSDSHPFVTLFERKIGKFSCKHAIPLSLWKHTISRVTTCTHVLGSIQGLRYLQPTVLRMAQWCRIDAHGRAADDRELPCGLVHQSKGVAALPYMYCTPLGINDSLACAPRRLQLHL